MASDLLPASPYPLSVSGKAAVAAINATALYVLAYLLVQAAFQLATIEVATRLGIGGVWHLGQLQFRLADSGWWAAAVVSVYGIGPLVSLALGLGALVGFWKWARRRRGLRKLFLFWVMLHGCNLALGALAADTLTQSGVWYVPSWLFMAGNVVNVLLALLAALVQMGLGYLAAVAFLRSHDSITLMRYPNRRLLLFSTLVGPWLLGSLLLLGVHWPGQALNERLRMLTMLLLVGPIYIAALHEAFEETVPLPYRTRLAESTLLLLLLAVLAWRLTLGAGVSFGN